MSALSVIYILLFYAASAVFLGGFILKVYGYASTPAPLKIPTTPAPITKSGVALRLAGEVLLFTSLFKGNKWTWLGGYVFHAAFAVVIFRHLRYFIQPVPDLMAYLNPTGIWAGVVLLGAAGYLLARRIYVDRVYYISSGADYFILILISLIAVTGLLMKFVTRTDVMGVKEFTLGLVTFSPENMPPDFVFVIHFTLVMALMIYFPFSKLMHLGGIFFSPTRNQVDDSRERRHVNPWAGA